MKIKNVLNGTLVTLAKLATRFISVKSGKADYAKLLADDLKADYSLGTASAVITESAPYDAEVIVGKEE